MWFDDPAPDQRPAKPSSDRVAISGIHHAASGSQLIGEAPVNCFIFSYVIFLRLVSEGDVGTKSDRAVFKCGSLFIARAAVHFSHPQRPSTITPPSPDPSERQSRLTVPSLLSVNAPVQGVAVPNVATSLLELRLIRKETCDTPAAVASFLQKLCVAMGLF